MTLHGYARVSTADQDPGIQEAALRAAGRRVVRAEKRSGAAHEGRDEPRLLLDFLRPGDTLVVTRVDRLARSVRDLQDIVHELKAKGVALKATEQPVDTGTAAGESFLDMPGVFAEFETALRRERQAEGELAPLAWLSRSLRGSGGEEHAATQQVEAGAAVHLPLQELEPGDPALGLAVAPRRRERRPDGVAVLLQSGREGLDGGYAARARVAQPSPESLERRLHPVPAAGAAVAHQLGEAARQGGDHRRLAVLRHARDGRGIHGRQPRRRLHEEPSQPFGEGSATGPPSPPGGVTLGRPERHRSGVLLAGAVRRSASQRCTCRCVPAKPRARSSRHSAIAFSHPAARRASKWAR